MTQREFQDSTQSLAATIEEIKQSAHALHASVNQTYDHIHPYAYHLDMVADGVYKYGYAVCARPEDVLPLLFGAYYHDSIEDARQTYNDVRNTARRFMDADQALLAAEIVYALTNDKGRTRAERAGGNYYRGIRQTPYAPFTKMADRLANITYSFTHSNDINGNGNAANDHIDAANKHGNAANDHMKIVYREEWPHFIAAIQSPHKDDVRFTIPPAMIEAAQSFWAEK